VSPELSEHGGDVGRGGGSSDRSRSKDGDFVVERLHGGKVDDGCDGDMNRGSVGVFLGKRDRGVSNGSCRVFIGEVIVAI
jgi:hypothetical protein